MEESWRFQQIDGNVCPSCHVSHFPFCPPLRPLYGNGFPADDPRRYPVEAPRFHGTVHAPPSFTEHRRMSPPPPPRHLSPMAPRIVEPWNGYSLPEREPLRQPFHTTERIFLEEFLEREKFHKRMRVGDEVRGYSVSPRRLDRFGSFLKGNSSEDERRLNLIRDHGRSHVDLPFDLERRRNGEYFPIDRHPHVGLQSHNAWIGADRDLYGPGSSLSCNNIPITHNPSVFNHKNHALGGSSYGDYQEPTGAPKLQNYDRFAHYEVKDLERKDLDTSNTVRLNSSHVEISPAPYAHFDAPSHPSRSYGYSGLSDLVTDSSKSYMIHNPDVSSKYKQYINEESASVTQKQRPCSPSHVSQGSQELLDQQQHLRQAGVSEAHYPLTNSYHTPFLSSARDYGHRDHFDREHVGSKYGAYACKNEVLPPFQHKSPSRENSFRPLDLQNYHVSGQSHVQIDPINHLPMQYGSNVIASVGNQVETPQILPPLPQQPLPRPPPEPSLSHFQVSSSLWVGPSPASPICVSLSVDLSRSQAAQSCSEAPVPSETYFCNKPPVNTSTDVVPERRSFIPQALSKQLPEGQAFSLKQVLKDKGALVDASHIFLQPHRTTRPDHIAVILRGLPGSGKSYLAKALRDLEVDNGGNAPRIHCMDDYFMTEIEKVEESDLSKSSGSVKGKKQVTRKIMEYCYEPEMEEAYRASMLKAFKKTVEDGIFNFVIVDDRNLRVADFAQFWAIGKRSGYEVYVLEATYKDPTGCAARNVHGFTLDDVKGMAEKWEEAPAFYLQLDIQSLFHGDDLNESNIQEVDMDMDLEDVPYDERVVLEGHETKSPKAEEQTLTDNTHEESAIIGERWITEGEDLAEARELGKSKWSKDFDEDVGETNGAKQQSNSLSGLIQAYSKDEKSVHWGDRADKRGFSIGASKKQRISSIVIGPGSGYNLKSNPLPEEESSVDAIDKNTAGTGNRSVFLEHIRAERESFRAVFDRRRQRIGGVNDVEDE